MADMTTIKGKIRDTIYPNGKGAITAEKHQSLLLDVVDNINELKQDTLVSGQNIRSLVSGEPLLGSGALGVLGTKFIYELDSQQLFAIIDGAQQDFHIWMASRAVHSQVAQVIEIQKEGYFKELVPLTIKNKAGLAGLAALCWEYDGMIYEASMEDNVLTVVSKPNTDAKLTELSAEIIGENIVAPFAIEKVEGKTFFDKKYISTNASALPSPIAYESASCMKIECKEGEQFRIVGKCSGASIVQLWAFWGADYALIEKSDINTPTSFREDILIVTAPQGAAYLTINMYQYTETDGVYLLNSITKKSIKDSVDSVPLVKELEEEVRSEYISYKDEIPQIEGVTFFDKKYINTNTSALPSPIAYESASCMKIECKEGEQFSIYAKCTTSVVLQLWAFWRADFSIIEKSNISVATSFREEPLNITAPKDAAYLTINMYQYQEGDKVLKTLSISKKDIADKLNKEDATSATPLFGKTIVCFGDSITEYADYNGKRYSDYISEFTGANVINVGVGGTRLEKRSGVVASPTNQTEAYAALDVMSLINAVVEQNFDYQFAAANSGYINKDTYLPIVQRLSEIDFAKVDAITIFAGTNSWRNSRTLGTTGQRDSEYYVLSAINLIIEKFSQKYPNIKIYWFLPIVRWIDNNGFTDANWCDNFSQSGYVPGDLSLTLGEFKDLVKTEVVKNHIPVCDLYDELGFNKFNFWNYFPRIDLGDRQTDGTHPLKGMNVIAKKIASFIQSNLLF